MKVAKWLGKHSKEAAPPTGVAEAHCVHCNAASSLRFVAGEFVCSNSTVCAMRQRGEINDDWEGYDRDLER
jgi:hypothetical protein